MKRDLTVIKYLLNGIEEVYQRPKMFAVSADGIMVALSLYHEIWALVSGRLDDYYSAIRKMGEEEKSGPYRFDEPYKHEICAVLNMSEDDAIAYVIRQWQRLDERLGIAGENREREGKMGT